MNREEFRVKSEELGQAAVESCASPAQSGLSTLHSSRSTSPSGFSLVEVMLAVGIVAFAVVGVLTAFPVGIEAARDARDENTAALIADSIFTYMRSQPWTQPNTTAATLKAPRMPSYWSINPMTITGGSWSGGSSPSYANMIYYSRNGHPSYSITGGKPVGSAPTSGVAFAPDEGYFGVQIYVRSAPYGTGSLTSPGNSSAGSERRDTSYQYLYSLACVIVEVSWPARQPYLNRKFKRNFDTQIANLH
ncbi:MAG: hypothetical protein WCV00_17665 [Verrucomicrobiia bacterium]